MTTDLSRFTPLEQRLLSETPLTAFEQGLDLRQVARIREQAYLAQQGQLSEEAAAREAAATVSNELARTLIVDGKVDLIQAARQGVPPLVLRGIGLPAEAIERGAASLADIQRRDAALEAVRPFQGTDERVDLVAALTGGVSPETLRALFDEEAIERAQSALAEGQQRSAALEAIKPFQKPDETVDLPAALVAGISVEVLRRLFSEEDIQQAQAAIPVLEARARALEAIRPFQDAEERVDLRAALAAGISVATLRLLFDEDVIQQAQIPLASAPEAPTAQLTNWARDAIASPFSELNAVSIGPTANLAQERQLFAQRIDIRRQELLQQLGARRSLFERELRDSGEIVQNRQRRVNQTYLSRAGGNLDRAVQLYLQDHPSPRFSVTLEQARLAVTEGHRTQVEDLQAATDFQNRARQNLSQYDAFAQEVPRRFESSVASAFEALERRVLGTGGSSAPFDPSAPILARLQPFAVEGGFDLAAALQAEAVTIQEAAQVFDPLEVLRASDQPVPPIPPPGPIPEEELPGIDLRRQEALAELQQRGFADVEDGSVSVNVINAARAGHTALLEQAGFNPQFIDVQVQSFEADAQELQREAEAFRRLGPEAQARSEALDRLQFLGLATPLGDVNLHAAIQQGQEPLLRVLGFSPTQILAAERLPSVSPVETGDTPWWTAIAKGLGVISGFGQPLVPYEFQAEAIEQIGQTTEGNAWLVAAGQGVRAGQRPWEIIQIPAAISGEILAEQVASGGLAALDRRTVIGGLIAGELSFKEAADKAVNLQAQRDIGSQLLFQTPFYLALGGVVSLGARGAASALPRATIARTNTMTVGTSSPRAAALAHLERVRSGQPGALRIEASSPLDTVHLQRGAELQSVMEQAVIQARRRVSGEVGAPLTPAETAIFRRAVEIRAAPDGLRVSGMIRMQEQLSRPSPILGRALNTKPVIQVTEAVGPQTIRQIVAAARDGQLQAVTIRSIGPEGSLIAHQSADRLAAALRRAGVKVNRERLAQVRPARAGEAGEFMPVTADVELVAPLDLRVRQVALMPGASRLGPGEALIALPNRGVRLALVEAQTPRALPSGSIATTTIAPRRVLDIGAGFTPAVEATHAIDVQPDLQAMSQYFHNQEYVQTYLPELQRKIQSGEVAYTFGVDVGTDPLPYGRDFFDKVVSEGLLSIEDLDTLLPKIAQILKNNGQVSLQVYSPTANVESALETFRRHGFDVTWRVSRKAVNTPGELINFSGSLKKIPSTLLSPLPLPPPIITPASLVPGGPRRVLDVGANIYPMPEATHAIDISSMSDLLSNVEGGRPDPAAIERMLNRINTGTLEYKTGTDFSESGYPDSYFDKVTAETVYPESPEGARKFIAEMRRVLKDGGTIHYEIQVSKEGETLQDYLDIFRAEGFDVTFTKIPINIFFPEGIPPGFEFGFQPYLIEGTLSKKPPTIPRRTPPPEGPISGGGGGRVRMLVTRDGRLVPETEVATAPTRLQELFAARPFIPPLAPTTRPIQAPARIITEVRPAVRISPAVVPARTPALRRAPVLAPSVAPTATPAPATTETRLTPIVTPVRSVPVTMPSRVAVPVQAPARRRQRIVGPLLASIEQPIPDPVPQPIPDPFPDPIPQPIPDPVPDPIPDPVPQPVPDPFPDPVPQPVPDIPPRFPPPPVPPPPPPPDGGKRRRKLPAPEGLVAGLHPELVGFNTGATDLTVNLPTEEVTWYADLPEIPEIPAEESFTVLRRGPRRAPTRRFPMGKANVTISSRGVRFKGRKPGKKINFETS